MTLLFISQSEKQLFQKLTEEINSQTGGDFAKLEDLVDPDIHVLLDEEATSYGVEEVKKFVTKLRNKPFKRTVQFGVIPRFDMFTIEAQNTMLKALEDHPKSTQYILGATQEFSLLATIKSRAKISYVESQKDIADNEALQKLVKTFLQGRKQLISTYKDLQDYSWNKQEALVFFQYIFAALSPKEKEFKSRLEQLSQASKMIHANIPPKQVVTFLLFKWYIEA